MPGRGFVSSGFVARMDEADPARMELLTDAPAQLFPWKVRQIGPDPIVVMHFAGSACDDVRDQMRGIRAAALGEPLTRPAGKIAQRLLDPVGSSARDPC